MAKQTSLITFTGKLGNMIGYIRNGKYCLRSMPEEVRQTKRTRLAARRFGIASKKGALIRSAFNNELDICCDSGHINRLNKTLVLAGSNNIGAITGFRFNLHTGTDRFFAIAPKLSRDGILHIPPQTLLQCNGFTALEVKVIAARINFGEGRIVNTETAMIILDPRQVFSGAALSVDIPGKGILVVTLQVRGIHDQIPTANAKYVAADIIAVAETQPQLPVQKKIYPAQSIIPQQQVTPSNPVCMHSCVSVIQRE